MKSFALAALAGLASADAWFEMFRPDSLKDIPTDAPYGEAIHSNMRRTGFGTVVETDTYANNYSESFIKAPLLPWAVDFARHMETIENATQYHMDMKAGKNNGSPGYTCANRNPYGDDTTGLALLPAYGGSINASNPTQTFQGTCFDEITMTYAQTSETTFDVTVETSNPTSKTCSDTVFFGNPEIQHVEIYFMHGTHTMHFEMNTKEAQDDMNFAGLHAFNFCETGVHEIESLWSTLKMFVGGLTDHPDWPVIGSHVPKYMEEANVKFIKEAMNVELEARETTSVDIDPSLIQSGDFLGVMRLDGLDQIIMYGTGAYIGHNVMALRMEDDELYILESQDAWYWPTHGLQRTKFADWIKYAEDASFHVTWHRMRDDVRATFDTQKAIDFFNQTKGMPYGYANFLYGWIDTAEDNWPPLLPVHFVPTIFSLLQKIAPATVNEFYTQALNAHLGTSGLDIQGIIEAASQQNLGIDDVMGMTEVDFTLYDFGG
jgi:hypothetical protein